MTSARTQYRANCVGIALAYHRKSVNPKERKISIDIQERGTRTEAAYGVVCGVGLVS